MLKHLMGHASEKSGDIYNKRYIRKKANKISLELQYEMQNRIEDYERSKNS